MKRLCFNVIMTANHILELSSAKQHQQVNTGAIGSVGVCILQYETSFNLVVQRPTETMLTYNKRGSSRLRPREAIHYESICLHYGDWIDTALKVGAGNKARRLRTTVCSARVEDTSSVCLPKILNKTLHLCIIMKQCKCSFVCFPRV
jgi:hypothetical protein